MAENVPGLVLPLISQSYLDYSKISPEKPAYRFHVTNRYRSKLIRAVFE